MQPFQLSLQEPIDVFESTFKVRDRFGKRSIGKKFDLTRNLSGSDIAAQVERDIDAAIESGRLPAMTFTVSGGECRPRFLLTVTVLAIGPQSVIETTFKNNSECLPYFDDPEIPGYDLSELGTYICKVLAHFLWRYNSDGYFPDSQYPGQKFYYQIVFAKALVQQQINALGNHINSAATTKG